MIDGDDVFGLLADLVGLMLGLALLAALVVAAVLLWRRFAPTSARHPLTGRSASAAAALGHPVAMAEQTLADRLARGEIDVVDYEERLAALRRGMSAGEESPGEHADWESAATTGVRR